MKRCFALVVFLILILSLAACGGREQIPAMEPKSGLPSGGGPVTSRPENDPDEDPDASGGDDSIPQADVALVREIVFTYGAEEDTYNRPGTIITKKSSLFYRDDGWSGENALDVSTYLSWVLWLPATEEEQALIDAGERYTEGRIIGGFDSRYVGPGEMVEEKIMSHFEVTLEHLHSDPEYYDGSIHGYFYPAGGGMGERPIVSFTFRQDGDILTIPVTLTSPSGSEPETTHTLTVRLGPGGGWKYLGCQVG